MNIFEKSGKQVLCFCGSKRALWALCCFGRKGYGFALLVWQ